MGWGRGEGRVAEGREVERKGGEKGGFEWRRRWTGEEGVRRGCPVDCDWTCGWRWEWLRTGLRRDRRRDRWNRRRNPQDNAREREGAVGEEDQGYEGEERGKERPAQGRTRRRWWSFQAVHSPSSVICLWECR